MDSAALAPLPHLLQSFLLRELRSVRRELERYLDAASLWITPSGFHNYHRRMVTGDATGVGAAATSELDPARPTGI